MSARRYQLETLDAFERASASRSNRFYVAMPPGSGRTVIGLEAARRLGRRVETEMRTLWS